MKICKTEYECKGYSKRYGLDKRMKKEIRKTEAEQRSTSKCCTTGNNGRQKCM